MNCQLQSTILLLSLLLILSTSYVVVTAWVLSYSSKTSSSRQTSNIIRTKQQQQLYQQQRILSPRLHNSIIVVLHDQLPKAGTFFNPVPDDDNMNTNNSNNDTDDDITVTSQNTIEFSHTEIIESETIMTETMSFSTSIESSVTTDRKIMNGAGIGFEIMQQMKDIDSNNNNNVNLLQSNIHTPKNQKPFVGIGPPMNDITKPEYDENGYTLYVDERTGIKSRVFEALVDYPCLFTMKIVGLNDLSFVSDILILIAKSCNVYDDYIIQKQQEQQSNDDRNNDILKHSTRINGKWISITVHAPVQSAEMLYQLYKNIDEHPLVKFKF